MFPSFPFHSGPVLFTSPERLDWEGQELTECKNGSRGSKSATGTGRRGCPGAGKGLWHHGFELWFFPKIDALRVTWGGNPQRYIIHQMCILAIPAKMLHATREKCRLS